MYIQSGLSGADGFGLDPVTAIELGTAAVSIGTALTTGGDFRRLSSTCMPMASTRPVRPIGSRMQRSGGSGSS